MTFRNKTARVAGVLYLILIIGGIISLVYIPAQSGFLPKILGILLMAGCFGYLIIFFGGFLHSDFDKTIISDIVGYPAPLGEFGICLWLLIMGTNKLNFGKKSGYNSYM